MMKELCSLVNKNEELEIQVKIQEKIDISFYNPFKSNWLGILNYIFSSIWSDTEYIKITWTDIWTGLISA